MSFVPLLDRNRCLRLSARPAIRIFTSELARPALVWLQMWRKLIWSFIRRYSESRHKPSIQPFFELVRVNRSSLFAIRGSYRRPHGFAAEKRLKKYCTHSFTRHDGFLCQRSILLGAKVRGCEMSVGESAVSAILRMIGDTFALCSCNKSQARGRRQRLDVYGMVQIVSSSDVGRIASG